MRENLKNARKSANITIKYFLNEREKKALEELLPFWQQYEGKDGTFPFRDWDIEKLLNVFAETGITTHICNQIKVDQWRKGLIDIEEMLNEKGFLLKEERGKEVLEDAETKNGR